MSLGAVLVEALKAIPDIVRAFRKPKPLPAPVKTEPLSTHPSATHIDASGNRRDF